MSQIQPAKPTGKKKEVVTPSGKTFKYDLDAEGNVLLSIAHGRGWTRAIDAINTTGIELPNQMEFQLADGQWAKAVALSYSAISTYSKCNRLYYYDYVLRLKAKRPAISMWKGVALHKASEELINDKIEGKELDIPSAVEVFKETFSTDISNYEKYCEDERAKGNEPIALSWGERGLTHATVAKLGEDMVRLLATKVIAKMRPLVAEKQISYRVPLLNAPGSVFFGGFADVIELDDKGEKMISDLKTGRVQTADDLTKTDQLTLYSLAEGIKETSLISLNPGTTGGSQPARAQPPKVSRVYETMTMERQERTIKDFNFSLEGIKAGSYGRTGRHNSTICGANLCASFVRCMAGKD